MDRINNPEVVFQKICNQIVSGKLKPGEKLREADLAAKFGISRGPLREAISRLEAKGLVCKIKNVGSSVVDLKPKDVIELYRIREAMEGIGARMAAESISDKDLKILYEMLDKQAVSQMEQFKTAGPIGQFDLDFHFMIIRASKNERLYNLLCVDLYYLLRLYRLKFTNPERIKKASRQHQQIFEAIEMRDGELAEILMRAHIRDSLNNIKRYLKLEGKIAG